MYPMDFEEYLYSKRINEELINYVKNCFMNKQKISDITTESYMKYFKEYLCVGGMPDVVDLFLRTNDLNQVYDLQKSILEQYKYDFGKHLDENEEEKINKKELARILDIYNTIPIQLSKENKNLKIAKLIKMLELENILIQLCD